MKLSGGGNWGRRGKAEEGGKGSGGGRGGVIMVLSKEPKHGFSSYVTCIVFLSKKSHNL